MYNLVVFASGNGSTLQAIIDAIANKKLEAQILLVISDNPNAYALERAKASNIPTYIIQNRKDFTKRDIELFDVLNREYVVVTFLAILEMARAKELIIKQENNFDDIICEVAHE